MQPPAKERVGPSNLEEARKESPLVPSKAPLDFRLLVSRVVREYISIGLGHSVVPKFARSATGD